MFASAHEKNKTTLNRSRTTIAGTTRMASMYTLEQVKNLKKGNKSYANDTYQSRKNNFRMKTWFFLAATNEGKQNAEQQNKQRASQKKGIITCPVLEMISSSHDIVAIPQ
ncbi:hypothetical protein QTP88_020270 [Uroleucon formosanum]